METSKLIIMTDDFYGILCQQFHARRDLLILLSGSLAVFLEVSFSFMPLILAQNDALRGFPTFFEGALRSLPGLALSYDFLPFSLRPPFLF
jgi:hypothetical protein